MEDAAGSPQAGGWRRAGGPRDAQELRVAVAEITAAHGIRGEVRVLPLTDQPERLSLLDRCWIRRGDGESLEARILRARPGPKGSWILQIETVCDRTRAESLRGARVEIAARDVRALPEGHYYHFELMGMEVHDEAGRRIGQVSGVVRAPAHDLWEVTPDGPGPPILVPAVRAIVVHVSREERRIVVRLPEGLA